MKRLHYISALIIIFLISGCSAYKVKQQAQHVIPNLMKNPANPYTCMVYSTPEESEQATRDYFKKELSKIQPDSKPLDMRALVVIPTLKSINETLLSGSKMNVSSHIEANYEFFGQAIQKKNIFKKADVKKSDQPKEVIATGYDVVLYPVWNTSAMPWEMEKWYLKRIEDGSVAQIDKAVSQESWLYNIKLAARGKPQLSSIKEPILPAAQNNKAVVQGKPGFVLGVVSTISEKEISLGENHNFQITEQTKILAGDKEIPLNNIKNGDYVQITFLYPQMAAVKIIKMH